MDDDTIRNLDSAIAITDPAPSPFDAFGPALLDANAPRLVGYEVEDLGFLDRVFGA